MKLSKYILILLSICCLSGCAHKSGHQNKRQTATSAATSENQPKRGSAKNTTITVVNNRGESDKLDGSKIFAKYNKAVFMVYTSDGYNTYQGSGFFY